MGTATDSNIYSAINEGNVTGIKQVGGVVGYISGGSLKSYSGITGTYKVFNKGNVKGYQAVGGVAGWAETDTDFTTIISAVSNTGTISCRGYDTNYQYERITITDNYKWNIRLTQTILKSTCRIAGIGGIVGYCKASIQNVQSSGEVTCDSVNDLTVTHTKGGSGAFGVQGDPWKIEIYKALASFGGIVGYFDGEQVIKNAKLTSQTYVGAVDLDSSKGTVCVGGLVGYLKKGCMIENTSTSMTSLTCRGSYFVGAIVGYSAATECNYTNAYNVQTTYNEQAFLYVRNPTYNNGEGYDGSSDWMDMGGGRTSKAWVTNGPRVGRMVNGSTYHVTDPDGTLSG